MPKALPDDLKKLVAEKYEKTNPPLKPSELSKWATAHFGRPVSGQVCTAIIKTTKRDQDRGSFLCNKGLKLIRQDPK